MLQAWIFLETSLSKHEIELILYFYPSTKRKTYVYFHEKFNSDYQYC